MSYNVKYPVSPSAKYTDVTCDGCGIQLKPGGPIAEYGSAWNSLQPDDSLIVHLVGGYGMAIDPCVDFTEQEFNILFCRDCTIKLCDQWPVIAKTVKKHCSSSIGHSCYKEESWVWKPYSDCCRLYCSGCGKASSDVKENPNNVFSRPELDCRTCNKVDFALYGSDRPDRLWYVYYQSPRDEDYGYVGPFDTKETALLKQKQLEEQGFELCRLDERLKI